MRSAQSKICKVKLTKGNERPYITKKILLAVITQFWRPERLFVQPLSCQCAKSIYSFFVCDFKEKNHFLRDRIFLYTLFWKKRRGKVAEFFTSYKIFTTILFLPGIFLVVNQFSPTFFPNILSASFSVKNSILQLF